MPTFWWEGPNQLDGTHILFTKNVENVIVGWTENDKGFPGSISKMTVALLP